MSRGRSSAIEHSGIDAAPVEPRLKPLLRYVRKLTQTPSRMTPDDAEAVYDVGWSDEALLHAVSARTGYPVDVLDETVPLEAGLGIDSIKTVEIFSNLKEYHKYFQSEDASEEDLLEQFSKLKTLQDIVRFYEQRRADITATPHAASERHAGNGSSTEKVHVQRMTLTAADAPLETGNGKKKTSRKSS